MKISSQTLLYSLFGMFLLLGQLFANDARSAAPGPDGYAGQIVGEYDDDPFDSGSCHLAIAVAPAAIPALSPASRVFTANAGAKPDIRAAHYFPDTRGSPAA